MNIMVKWNNSRYIVKAETNRNNVRVEAGIRNAVFEEKIKRELDNGMFKGDRKRGCCFSSEIIKLL